MSAYSTTFTAVTPNVGDNPKALNWYEYSSVEGIYLKTTDTTVQNGKTYYEHGFLIRVGSYPIPFRFIKYDTYNGLWSTTDVDSFRDANNTAHRDSVCERHVMKVEFETPDLSDSEFDELMSNIESQYLGTATLWNGKQAKTCRVTAWIPEKRAYKTDYCYVPDINIQIRYADEDKLKYEPVRFAFIGYATEETI